MRCAPSFPRPRSTGILACVDLKRHPMTETLNFDVLIIGGGQAGPPLARALAKAGKTVALAERKYLGGSCVNFGCTPTKAAIASARVEHLARRPGDFGSRISQRGVDFP